MSSILAGGAKNRQLSTESCRFFTFPLFTIHSSTLTGKEKWTSVAIDKILSNEKYVGDVLLQKTYTPNIFDKKQVKNKGDIGSYLYENNHIGIIDGEIININLIKNT